MPSASQITGRRGEDEACLYLVRAGHTIIERNWRGGHTEIDIISLAGDGIHFVEVKSRKAPVMAAPERNVDRKKMHHLQAAALRWLHSPKRAPMQEMEIFFDVISVVFDNDSIDIQYYPQAFVPIYV